MCDLCDIKPGEKRLGRTLAPSMCWAQFERTENGILKLVFGYGEDPNDRIWLRLNHCPYCGEKQ